MIDHADLRRRSIERAKQLGCLVNESLPLLDAFEVTRSRDQIVDRILGMLCVAACAYGFDRNTAVAWLNRESKSVLLTPEEREFLSSGSGDRQQFMMRIEGIWTLAWSIGIIAVLDFSSPCSQDFVTRLPDMKRNKSCSSFRAAAQMRQVVEIIAANDLAYCLHWAVRDTELKRITGLAKVQPYVIVERRRALEWLLSDEDWDDVALDT